MPSPVPRSPEYDGRVIDFLRQVDRETRTYVQETLHKRYVDCVGEFNGRVRLNVDVAEKARVWQLCGNKITKSSVRAIAKESKLRLVVRPVKWCFTHEACIKWKAYEILHS